MPLTILELLLKIVILAMEGQTPEQRATMWGIYLRDLEWWRQRFKIDPSPAPAVQSVATVGARLRAMSKANWLAPVQSVARAPRRRTR